MLRNREGFTLIELLIVVVIIGILAAIALPKFGQTREAAYYTTLKADLNNLRSAEEMYYQTDGDFSYTTTLGTSGLEFSPSRGVSITVTEATGIGWAATATHSALPSGDGCSIAYGDVASPPTSPAAVAADQFGAPVCTDMP